jgi:hypothetical protein
MIDHDCHADPHQEIEGIVELLVIQFPSRATKMASSISTIPATP